MPYRHDDRPHDPKPVAVFIENKPIGSPDREAAGTFQRDLACLGSFEGGGACDAILVGARDRGGGEGGQFGVKLDLATARRTPGPRAIAQRAGHRGGPAFLPKSVIWPRSIGELGAKPFIWWWAEPMQTGYWVILVRIPPGVPKRGAGQMCA